MEYPEMTWAHVGMEQRSLELARARHPRGADCRFSTMRRDGVEFWRVRSHTNVTQWYKVAYSPRLDRVLACDCTAGLFDRACSHKGEARLSVERRKVRCVHLAATSPAVAAQMMPRTAAGRIDAIARELRGA